jgi:hypothetical protein
VDCESFAADSDDGEGTPASPSGALKKSFSGMLAAALPRSDEEAAPPSSMAGTTCRCSKTQRPLTGAETASAGSQSSLPSLTHSNDSLANCGPGTDLFSWARSLGVSYDKEPLLFSIMTEAFHHPLPAGWSRRADKRGHAFFYNENVRASSWQHPLDRAHRQLVASCRRIIQALDCDDTCKQELEAFHRQGQDEVASWRESRTPDGTSFYYRVHEEATSFVDPREAVLVQTNFFFKMVASLAARLQVSRSPSAPP